MKVEREEVVFSYETEQEGFNHKSEMERKGWKVKDVHPFLLKITYVK